MWPVTAEIAILHSVQTEVLSKSPFSMSLLPPGTGEKVADRPDEGADLE